MGRRAPIDESHARGRGGIHPTSKRRPKGKERRDPKDKGARKEKEKVECVGGS